MPPVEDEIQGDQTTTGDAPAPVSDSQTPATGEVPQSSSGQDGPETPDLGKEPATMADAIAAALQSAPKEDGPSKEDGPKSEGDDESDDKSKSDPGKSSEPAEGEGSEAANAEDADPSEDELKGYSRPVQKRIRQLLSQRSAARREAEELRTDAGNYRQVREFMAQSNLEDREVAELFQLGADLKSGDPVRLQRFIQRAMPTLNAVLEAVGQAVPADLRQRVEQGELTEDAAKELGRTRHEAQTARAAAQRQAQQVQSHVAVARQQQVYSAVEQWQQQVKATDPDFGMKADAMTRAAQALVAERGLPKTPQEALAMAKDAYAEVNRWFSSVRPAPKATRPAPASGTSANRTGMAAAPATLEEAIRQGMEAATRR